MSCKIYLNQNKDDEEKPINLFSKQEKKIEIAYSKIVNYDNFANLLKN